MAVARRANRDPGCEVEKAVAINIVNHRPATPFDSQGIDARVGGRRIAFIRRNQLRRQRPRQFCADAGYPVQIGSLDHPCLLGKSTTESYVFNLREQAHLAVAQGSARENRFTTWKEFFSPCEFGTRESAGRAWPQADQTAAFRRLTR